MTKGREIRVVEDPKAIFRAAAEEFAARAAESIRKNGLFTVCLAGGSTPKGLYSLLAGDPAFRDRVAWEKVHFFFGDERHVPPDHADNNYRMAYEAMLSKLPAPPWNTHRHATEAPADFAAEYYEKILGGFFKLKPGELPRFDLVLLGMGPDGHTASLFPGTAAVHEKTRLCVAPWVEKFKSFRVTLTPHVLNNAAAVMFMAAGADKAGTLKEVLEGPYEPDRLPSQVIRPGDGEFLWLVDRPAARLLTTTS